MDNIAELEDAARRQSISALLSPVLKCRNQFLYIILLVCNYHFGHISAAVRAAGDVAKATVHELISVIFFFIMACIMFGTIIYIIEAPTNSVFASIPDSMWWSWQTMFCLGYGDIVPTSLIGKIVASWLTIFGIIIIAALIISLGGRFFEIYKSILEYEIHSI